MALMSSVTSGPADMGETLKTDYQSFSMCFCVSIRMISSEIWNNLARVIFLKANEIARGDCNF